MSAIPVTLPRGNQHLTTSLSSSMNTVATLDERAAQHNLTILSDVVYKTTKALVFRLSSDFILQIDARCSVAHMTSLYVEKMAGNDGVKRITILVASSKIPIIAAQIQAIVSCVADKLAGREPQTVRDLLDQHLSLLNLVSLIGANMDLDAEELLERANEEYFRDVVSLDCSSCRNSIFDTVSNRNLLSNDGGDRTAYSMTEALFGYGDVSEGQPDCACDYDSYECSYCTLERSDANLGYHAMVFPEVNVSENMHHTLIEEAKAQKHLVTVPDHDELKWNTASLLKELSANIMALCKREECRISPMLQYVVNAAVIESHAQLTDPFQIDCNISAIGSALAGTWLRNHIPWVATSVNLSSLPLTIEAPV